jgi:NADH-quinone oxidoreductase subunit N
MNAIIVSALLGVVMMFSGILFKKSSAVQWVAIVGIIVLMGFSILDFITIGEGTKSFFNMIESNAYICWFNILITFCCLVYFFIFHKDIAAVGKNDAEYFALMFFIMCGVFLLSSYSNLLILFIGIEILSIPQYILAGSDKESFKSNEASLKYFLMGAFSTGFLLMGITLIYGKTGSFDINAIGVIMQGEVSVLSMLGIIFLVVAFGFKASAVPFHTWTPDVYDGTPTPFTPFMASVVKVAVMVAFVKLFHTAFGTITNVWGSLILGIILATLLVGNITAVYQQSVKRMLAYSSIAQAGFMLFALYSFGPISDKGLLLYAATYILATMGVFSTLIYLKDYTYEGFNGLAQKHPVVAFTTSICMLSLAGIPLTGGFFAKYYMLNAGMQNGMPIWAIIFAVLMAAVSVYYYFNVIRAMYFKTALNHDLFTHQPEAHINWVLIINAIALLLLGILPNIATIF